MKNKRTSGSALMMALVFMTLLLTLAAGTMAAAEFQVKSSVVARSVEAGYYTVESVAQLALDLFLEAVNVKDEDEDAKISLHLVKEENLGDYDDYDDYDDLLAAIADINIDEDEQKSKLKDNLQAQFEEYVAAPVEAMKIDDKSPIVLVDWEALIEGFEFIHDEVTYENDDDELIYSHETYIENPSFEFTVSLGGREITVKTNAETEFTAGTNYEPPTGGGGFVQDGNVLGGAAVIGAPWGVDYSSSENNTLESLINDKIDEINASGLTLTEKEALINKFIEDIKKLMEETLNSFVNTIDALISEQKAKRSNPGDIIGSYPDDYAGTSKRLTVSSQSDLDSYNPAIHKELYFYRFWNSDVVLNGSDYPGLEYICSDQHTVISLKGGFPSLKYIKTDTKLTFADYSSYDSLEYIYVPANLGANAACTVAGDFESLKGIYSNGNIALGNKDISAPFTTDGKNNPQIWAQHLIEVYFFGGETTKIMNATVFSYDTPTQLLPHGVSKTNPAQFSSNAIFISEQRPDIPLDYIDWDENCAPQFYSKWGINFQSHLPPGEECTIRGIFAYSNTDVLSFDPNIDLNLQGFLVAYSVASGMPDISALNPDQLSNVPQAIMDILWDLSDFTDETVGSGEPLVPAKPGSAGKFTIKSNNALDLRETTGGNP